MTPAFAAKLGLSTQPTNVGAHKIDCFTLKIYEITISGFLIQERLGKIRFLEVTFLLANTTVDVVPGMPFLSLSNADIQFDTRNLTCRTYSTTEDLPTTRQVELINKHEFARATLDENSEAFIIHVADLEALDLAIHLSRAPLLAVLQQDKAPTEIPSEYADYTDVFSPDLAIELSEITGIKNMPLSWLRTSSLPTALSIA